MSVFTFSSLPTKLSPEFFLANEGKEILRKTYILKKSPNFSHYFDYLIVHWDSIIIKINPAEKTFWVNPDFANFSHTTTRRISALSWRLEQGGFRQIAKGVYTNLIPPT